MLKTTRGDVQHQWPVGIEPPATIGTLMSGVASQDPIWYLAESVRSIVLKFFTLDITHFCIEPISKNIKIACLFLKCVGFEKFV